VHVALQSSGFVAGLMVTTEAMTAPVPEEYKPTASGYPPV
jgi:hypothetical protein